MSEHSITRGLRGTKIRMVTTDMTAIAMKSGSVKVFATPAMVALMEAAAVYAIDPFIAPGFTSVGIQIQIQHLAATAVGKQVRAEAEVIKVEEDHLWFYVEAWEGDKMIGRGDHERVIIETERFMRRLRS